MDPVIMDIECQAGTRDWTDVGLMLDQRLRRWANIKPALVQPIALAGSEI